MSPATDLASEAIWNTNAFFAYVITVKLFGLKWEPRRLLAVLLATFGVIAVVYGGSTSNGSEQSIQTNFTKPSAPLVGDLLTLIASVGYGLYQVLYKKYAAISTNPDELLSEESYDHLPTEDPAPAMQPDSPLITATSSGTAHVPPFGLYANFLTSAMGFLTCIILWLPIPFLHYAGIEPFRLPPNLTAVLAIAGISLSGVVFNAGFMASY
ncbi:hypothetical protein H0H87_000140 [Tephrocybe sp. NHM501043]|nr:hypothetical protein H0H87_000140 [Tephrocybe sp. NHM501043]